MTETNATTPGGPPMFPPGRYGRRRAERRRRPWLTALVAVVLAAVLGVLSVRMYRMYGDPVYDAQVITYTGITDTGIQVDFRTTVPAGGSAICVVRARSRDGAEVGREEVRVTAQPGQRHVTTRHQLTTRARAFIGEVPRCRPPNP